MRGSKKVTVIIAGLSIMMLTSCSTSSFMGLSKSKYVENEINEINQSLASIEELENRLLEVEHVASNISTLEDKVDQVIKIENDLIASNTALKTRIESLPTEILVGLVNAIQAYLETLSPSE